MGTTFDDCFGGGDTLKATELVGDSGPEKWRLRINGFKRVNFAGEGEPPREKPVITFHNIDSELPLNATRHKAIKELFGGVAENWVDKVVIITATKVDFGGKKVWGIALVADNPDIDCHQDHSDVSEESFA